MASAVDFFLGTIKKLSIDQPHVPYSLRQPPMEITTFRKHDETSDAPELLTYFIFIVFKYCETENMLGGKTRCRMDKADEHVMFRVAETVE